LLQHVPDLISIGLGADSHPARTRVLAVLSVVGVAGAVILGRLVLTRVGQRAWFWVFLVAVFNSPLLAYARTTFGEPLAAGLLVALVAATVLQAPPPLVALAVLAACWTKETSYPFVAAVGVLGLVLARRRTGIPIRRHVVWGAAGMAVAIAVASLFNIVRFGSVLNKNYLDSQLHTHGILRQLEYAAAVVVSPSGGMFVFWPVASVVVAAACLLPFLPRDRRDVDRWPALVLIAVILALSLGFAAWWTPLGWAAYGPRFALPWGLPLLLLAIVAYGDQLSRLARRLVASWWSFAVATALIVVLTVPHVGAVWHPNAAGRFFLQPKPPCEAPWRGGASRWQSCQARQMWLDRPMSLYALDGVENASGIGTAIVVALGVVGSMILFRLELLGPRRRGEVTIAEAPQPSLAQAHG
jgi:hypothetical protein